MWKFCKYLVQPFPTLAPSHVSTSQPPLSPSTPSLLYPMYSITFPTPSLEKVGCLLLVSSFLVSQAQHVLTPTEIHKGKHDTLGSQMRECAFVFLSWATPLNATFSSSISFPINFIFLHLNKVPWCNISHFIVCIPVDRRAD